MVGKYIAIANNASRLFPTLISLFFFNPSCDVWVKSVFSDLLFMPLCLCVSAQPITCHRLTLHPLNSLTSHLLSLHP